MIPPSPENPPLPKRPPRRPWQRYLLQFSLRTLLLLITVAAVLCWWFLRPQLREEQLAGQQLTLRRQVRLEKIDRASLPPATARRLPGEFAIRNVGSWQLQDGQSNRLVAGNYQNNRKHGLWTTYHVNGRKAAAGQVLNDARTGRWRTWNEHGQLLSEVTFLAEHSGTSEIEIPIETGAANPARKKASTPTSYSAAFILEQVKNYQSLRHGPARTWHPTGQPHTTGSYQNNLRQGPWTFHDPTGKLTKKITYEKGQPLDVLPQ